MLRRTILMMSAAALAAGGYAATTASAAPGGGACSLSGAANFAPNGPGNLDSFGYNFSGDLSNCQSNVGAPASGTISAGNTETANGATYQEPAASGTGQVPGASCAAGQTSGTAIVTWVDGTHTVISYTTQSVGAAVELTGTVIDSVTLPLVSGPTGSAPTITVVSDNTALPVGDSAQGALAFEVTDPTQCTTDAGVSAAGIDGVVGVGATG